MSQYLPRYRPGSAVPVVASAAVTGGTLITWAGAPTTDAQVGVAGVAGFDAASGTAVPVHRDGIQTLTASGAIAVNDPLCAAANGQIRKWITGTDAVGSRIATACTAATSGNPVTVALHGV